MYIVNEFEYLWLQDNGYDVSFYVTDKPLRIVDTRKYEREQPNTPLNRKIYVPFYMRLNK